MRRAILDRLNFSPDHAVLDIGCGDASLLASIPVVASRAGTVLTGEEAARLAGAPHLAGIRFLAASFDDLAEFPETFDCVIVNGSLHFTRTAPKARRALANISRLMRPGGKLWLGELFAHQEPRKEYVSKFKAVHRAWKHHGLRFAAALGHHIIRRRQRAERFVEPLPRAWYVSPDVLPALAAEHGLVVEKIWRCQDMTGDPFYALQDRFSVLLSKP